jgi:hypothetical protein
MFYLPLFSFGAVHDGHRTRSATTQHRPHSTRNPNSVSERTNSARLLMRMRADLVLFVEKRERLKSPEAKRKWLIDVS